MASISDNASVPTCKRSDGRGWRCGRPVAEGKGYCESHIKQAQLRQKRQPVPDNLKLHRTPKMEQESDVGVSDAPERRRKRKMPETSVGVSDVPQNRGKRVKTEDSGTKVVKLEMGTMEIATVGSSSEVRDKVVSPAVKVGVPASTEVRRPIRSKNSEPIPVPVVKRLPGIKENVNAKEKSNKKKIVKKCHWCKLTSFCVLVLCLTCKINSFCEECINKRYYCKKTVQRECPVCQGECPCRACKREKSKQVKTKEAVIYDVDSEKEVTVSNREKMSDFEKSQHLHMIKELLPVISKMNQEKITALDTEARNKGISHGELESQIAGRTEKRECSFCKACIPDVHRSCDHCSFVLCIDCCDSIREGDLQLKLQNLKETKMIRSKRSDSENKSWRSYSDGRISCPPKHAGGCEEGVLHLTSFYPFNLTKDLEETAKQILCNFQLNGLSDSSVSPCMMCDENGEHGLYFSTKKDFKDSQLDHFMKHWGKGQPIVIRDVVQNQPDWDFGFMLREYLNKSAESRNNTEPGSACSTRDWCEVEFGRKQIFSGGRTHENVWTEFLKFKLQFSSEFLQDHFPEHHHDVIKSLPVQEYMNPYTGFMNLGACQTKNPNLGSYVCMSYGGFDNPLNASLFSDLRVHGCDVVNVLVHASVRPISESSLNEVKVLMNEYNSQDHIKSSKKIANRNKVEGMFASTSRVDDTRHSDVNVDSTSSRSDESGSESDEDLAQFGDTCGAHWDIFRREDVPKLLEYLRKYSDKLSRSHASVRKFVHPLFDEVFYLDEDHKTRLKEEFDVDALSVEQHVGEAVIIPAGCPYQMKKVMSCVHVVCEFMSPESATDSIKVSDEVRLLPARHKAKGKTVQVKSMAVSRMQAAVEAMREVVVSQPEWSWPLVISHSAKSPS